MYKLLDKLPRDPKFAYVQPNGLEVTRRERPDGPRQLGDLSAIESLMISSSERPRSADEVRAAEKFAAIRSAVAA